MFFLKKFELQTYLMETGEILGDASNYIIRYLSIGSINFGLS
jgi:hypothetical protein